MFLTNASLTLVELIPDPIIIEPLSLELNLNFAIAVLLVVVTLISVPSFISTDKKPALESLIDL